MRHALIALSLLLCSLNPAFAQLSINFAIPGMNIGINLPVYPTLQRVPGYPVYYAPAMGRNYFFYDGLYWVYEEDNWYASSWYNGPWGLVDPQDVPLYLLRVPVRYYRHAPAYFQGWRSQDPPRWGEHWGQSWEQRHSGWDRWDRKSAPAPAPLPTYQRQYSGSRYPQASQQAVLETRNYRYQPKDPVAQQHFQQVRAQPAPAAAPQPAQPAQQPQQPRQTRPQQAPAAREQPAPRAQPQRVERKPQPAPVAREQQAPKQQTKPLERKPQPAPVAREQQAPQKQPLQIERKPQPAPVAREKPAPQKQPLQIERKLQQAPVAREQQAPRPQAQEKAPQERGKGQGKEQGGEKDNKDNKDK